MGMVEVEQRWADSITHAVQTSNAVATQVLCGFARQTEFPVPDPVDWLLEHTDLLTDRRYDATWVLRLVWIAFAAFPRESIDCHVFALAAREQIKAWRRTHG